MSAQTGETPKSSNPAEVRYHVEQEIRREEAAAARAQQRRVSNEAPAVSIISRSFIGNEDGDGGGNTSVVGEAAAGGAAVPGVSRSSVGREGGDDVAVRTQDMSAEQQAGIVAFVAFVACACCCILATG